MGPEYWPLFVSPSYMGKGKPNEQWVRRYGNWNKVRI